jgi:hypothetical protein
MSSKEEKMKNMVILMVIFAACALFVTGCEESEEGVDNNNDIIVRNYSEFDLWIAIDGFRRGHIEDDGIAETMWDGIDDGVHLLEAFYDNDYTLPHCDVTTYDLDDGQDFYWYLNEDFEYGGSKEGDC